MTNHQSKGKFFQGKRVYFHTLKSTGENINKTADIIKTFGGVIEQFCDHEISYVITDVHKSEWPPHGRDETLQRAAKLGVKLMSLHELIDFCAQYVASQSSSDEDEDSSNVRILQSPYLKFQGARSIYAPTFKEFNKWPEFKPTPLGVSIFNDLTLPTRPVCNTTCKRKSIYCEICSVRTDKIDEHVNSEEHKLKTESLDWQQVNSVIESLPSLNTLNKKRISNLTPPNGIEHQEFVCLHKSELEFLK